MAGWGSKTLSERSQGRARTEINTNEALLGTFKLLKEIGKHSKWKSNSKSRD